MTTFTGTIAGSGNQSGTLVITVSATVLATAAVKAQDAATATAVLTLINGGGTFNLSGTFDTVSGALNLSGGGFTLTGTISKDQVTGTYTGPNNVTGAFTNLDSTHTTVTTYCGTYQASHDSGVWNLQVSANGSADGSAYVTSGTGHAVFLTGSLNGTSLEIVTSDGVDVNGTVQNGTVVCSFIDKDGRPGTCSGATCH
jgi:hypothetical protein